MPTAPVPAIRLRTESIRAEIDPGRGSDILSLVDVRTGIDVLFRTPWRSRADAVRSGQAPSTADPTAAWLEQYRGGWQTLCPVAGDPRRVHGAPVGFHGEASVVPWAVDEVTSSSARLHVELFSVPVRIDRVVELQGATITVTDTLTNLSDVTIGLDYSHHPALGGPLLDGPCVIETGATRFVSDPERATALAAGATFDWPHAADASGEPVDLAAVPAPGSRRELFGWLDGFAQPFATIVNPGLGLGVRLDWDGALLPYAWLWQELNQTDAFPWYRRARVLAIEPASVPTSGPDRASTLRLGPGASARIPVSITIEDRRT
ncbi:DUF4432 family protein [Leifsonia sp. NPDC058230]|uniref:DUF4432 family protein n=1 Tax=Leifsonia sp. NPDC058230 TaxID=3346391 RepID=UPI0036DF82DA